MGLNGLMSNTSVSKKAKKIQTPGHFYISKTVSLSFLLAPG